jgi:sugar lactone lactonase YvrE
VGKVAEEEEQMYPQRRMSRQALGLGLVALIVLTVSACGGGSGAKGRAAEEASRPELTTVTGDGGEQLGDGGPATEAGFCGPNDVTFDTAGNMHISDGGIYCGGPGGYTVRKVNPDGTIITVAGTGEVGFSGDGGPATKAQLNVPMAVAVDREGSLYIADSGDYRIRKVDKDGIITTIAGTGEEGYSGDGGPATSAKLTYPSGLSFDDRGNLYIADELIVRKIDPSGTITTVAGTGRGGHFSGDGGPATEAKLTAADVALDASGNLFIADGDNHRVRKVDKDGIIHTVAGSGKKGNSGDGGPATKAALNEPSSIDFDGEGNLFILCHRTSEVRKVDKNGTITTVAGTGETGFNREEGTATKVMLNEPVGLFVDDDPGVLYISDTFNARIRAVYLENS